MEDIDFSDLINQYKQGKIERVSLIKSLKSIIENEKSSSLRIQALTYLNDLNILQNDLYLFLESIFLSDSDIEIKKKILEMLLENYCDKSENAIKWMINHTNHPSSLDMIGFIFQKVENYNTKVSRRLRMRIFCEYGLKYYQKFEVVPREAIGLGLLSKYLGYELDKWGNALFEFANIAIGIKSHHVNLIVSSEVPMKEIKFMEFFPKLEELEISCSELEKIEGLEILINLRRLELSSNYIQKISGLNSLINLEELYLDGNPIKKVEGLDNLRNLRELDLSYTKISEIDPFYELNRNMNIYLEETSIPKKKLIKFYDYNKNSSS
ncbi:MAG: leucine-rich repeat domain-containing protein [Candidatus Lokiarchaeota archaeon]